MLYPCDRFVSRWVSKQGPDWQQNVRAIALGLEALRKSSATASPTPASSTQGSRPSPPPRHPASHMTRDRAVAVLRELRRRAARAPQPRAAVAPLHLAARAARSPPDRHAGDQTKWTVVEQAAQVLGSTDERRHDLAAGRAGPPAEAAAVVAEHNATVHLRLHDRDDPQRYPAWVRAVGWWSGRPPRSPATRASSWCTREPPERIAPQPPRPVPTPRSPMIVRLTTTSPSTPSTSSAYTAPPATDATPGDGPPAQPAKPEHTIVMLTHGPLLHRPRSPTPRCRHPERGDGPIDAAKVHLTTPGVLLRAVSPSICRHDHHPAPPGRHVSGLPGDPCRGGEDRRRRGATGQGSPDVPLVNKPLSQILTFWRPGSHDWTWKEEFADLIDHPVTEAIRRRVDAEGFDSSTIAPVMLGSDGRVWDGTSPDLPRHRAGRDRLMVEIVEPVRDVPAHDFVHHGMWADCICGSWSITADDAESDGRSGVLVPRRGGRTRGRSKAPGREDSGGPTGGADRGAEPQDVGAHIKDGARCRVGQGAPRGRSGSVAPCLVASCSAPRAVVGLVGDPEPTLLLNHRRPERERASEEDLPGWRRLLDALLGAPCVHCGQRVFSRDIPTQRVP